MVRLRPLAPGGGQSLPRHGRDAAKWREPLCEKPTFGPEPSGLSFRSDWPKTFTAPVLPGQFFEGRLMASITKTCTRTFCGSILSPSRSRSAATKQRAAS